MDLLTETLALRARYDEEPTHSDQVALLTLQLFDGLQPWHRCDARFRELIHAAALLHDIGWSQVPDGRGHHKWSARLIQKHAWENLKAAEIVLVAQVARYHRKSLPKPSHAEFEALTEEVRQQVMILGGIVRLADALDRTHTAKIARLEAKSGPNEISIQVETKGDWIAERDTFAVKKDMLERAAERPVRCVG